MPVAAIDEQRVDAFIDTTVLTPSQRMSAPRHRHVGAL